MRRKAGPEAQVHLEKKFVCILHGLLFLNKDIAERMSAAKNKEIIRSNKGCLLLRYRRFETLRVSGYQRRIAAVFQEEAAGLSSHKNAEDRMDLPEEAIFT